MDSSRPPSAGSSDGNKDEDGKKMEEEKDEARGVKRPITSAPAPKIKKRAIEDPGTKVKSAKMRQRMQLQQELVRKQQKKLQEKLEKELQFEEEQLRKESKLEEEKYEKAERERLQSTNNEPFSNTNLEKNSKLGINTDIAESLSISENKTSTDVLLKPLAPDGIDSVHSNSDNCSKSISNSPLLNRSEDQKSPSVDIDGSSGAVEPSVETCTPTETETQSSVSDKGACDTHIVNNSSDSLLPTTETTVPNDISSNSTTNHENKEESVQGEEGIQESSNLVPEENTDANNLNTDEGNLLPTEENNCINNSQENLSSEAVTGDNETLGSDDLQNANNDNDSTNVDKIDNSAKVDDDIPSSVKEQSANEEEIPASNEKTKKGRSKSAKKKSQVIQSGSEGEEEKSKTKKSKKKRVRKESKEGSDSEETVKNKKAKKGESSGDDNSSSDSEGDSGKKGRSKSNLGARPKVKNIRKNIRDILSEDKLEEDTLAAQKEEKLRLQRLQEKRNALREYMEKQEVCNVILYFYIILWYLG